jgi:hypothetical protein
VTPLTLLVQRPSFGRLAANVTDRRCATIMDDWTRKYRAARTEQSPVYVRADHEIGNWSPPLGSMRFPPVAYVGAALVVAAEFGKRRHKEGRLLRWRSLPTPSPVGRGDRPKPVPYEPRRGPIGRNRDAVELALRRETSARPRPIAWTPSAAACSTPTTPFASDITHVKQRLRRAGATRERACFQGLVVPRAATAPSAHLSYRGEMSMVAGDGLPLGHAAPLVTPVRDGEIYMYCAIDNPGDRSVRNRYSRRPAARWRSSGARPQGDRAARVLGWRAERAELVRMVGDAWA